VLARPISAGGDTDTIASLTGQLSGTVVGATGVRRDLFGGVEGSEEIFQIVGRFAKFVSAREK
jgi:ADP-ribosylglycohydrolase